MADVQLNPTGVLDKFVSPASRGVVTGGMRKLRTFSDLAVTSSIRCSAVLLAAFLVGVAVPWQPLDAQNTAPVVPARQVVDGVLLLQHPADAFERAPKWSLAPSPLATAGGPDVPPEFDLTNVDHVEILSDGRLVTLAGIGSRLLLFGPDGRPEKVIARPGRGPGELWGPRGMSRTAGDTLVIPDRANNRLNWIVAAKGVVKSSELPRVSGGDLGRPVGALRDGALVTTTAGRVLQATGDSVSRPPASILALPPNGSSATAIASIPDLELVLVPTSLGGPRGAISTPVRFTRSAKAVAWDTVIATGAGDGYRIDLRDTRGQLRASMRVSAARRLVTNAMREAAVAAALRRFEGPRSEGLVNAAESKRIEHVTPAADSLPPYGEWYVAPNQTLWVVDARALGDSRCGATAFRQDGAILGRLTWTGSGVPVAFGTDRVVMRETDANGVVSLRTFRIRESPRP